MPKKKKDIIEDRNKEEKLSLEKVVNLSSEEQFNEVEKTLKSMYGENVQVENAHVLKCIKLLSSKKEDSAYLSYGLVVDKTKDGLVFSFRKHTNFGLFFGIMTSILVVASFSATYSGITFAKLEKINIDIDGDGIADLNIDRDDDKSPDINITADGKVPIMNIDYKGNRMSVFNIDTDMDDIADSNMVNDATGDNLKICTVNCDSNGDGWPDFNIDIDGDGTLDLDIDTNKDGIPDRNIDRDGDGVCDLQCYDEGSDVCNKYCLDVNVETEEERKQSGSSTVTGNETQSLSSFELEVIYTDQAELVVGNMFPDDQPNVEIIRPTKEFTITNNSKYTLIYNLSWVVNKNTYLQSNFKYKIDSSNGGYNSEYKTAPSENVLITEGVSIAPYTTQKYTVTFNLEGTGEPQDYDQGKTFSGYVKVGD